MLFSYNWYAEKLHPFKLYNLLGLDLSIYLKNHYHNQGNKHIYHLQKHSSAHMLICVLVCFVVKIFNIRYTPPTILTPQHIIVNNLAHCTEISSMGTKFHLCPVMSKTWSEEYHFKNRKIVLKNPWLLCFVNVKSTL